MITSEYDRNEDPMTDEELDRLLGSAGAVLEARVNARSDVDVLLSNLLDVRREPSMPEPTPLMARVRLRRIIADLYRAEVLTNSLTKVMPEPERLGDLSEAVAAAFAKASTDDLGEVSNLALLLNVAAARALSVTMAPIATEDILFEGHISALIKSLVSTIGRSLARASDLAMDLPRIPRVGDEEASRDLRGLDLVNHNVGSVQILFDFIWDTRTVWPPALEKEAKMHSYALGDEIYRIKYLKPFCDLPAARVA